MPATTAKQLASEDLSLPSDTYIYSLARLQKACAAISSNDSLTYFDPTTLKVVHKANRIHDGVTCLKASPNSNGCATAGRDGLVKCWDERAGATGMVFREPRSAALSALAVADRYIAAGTESDKEGLADVSVLLWDTRNASTPVRQYTESHTDTLTQLAFHPSAPQTLLSASTDGLVSLFDTAIADEDDALTQVLNHHSAVHCAGFANAQEVYAVSSDEQVAVYTLAGPGDEDEAALATTSFGDVRATLGCAYVVDVIRGGGQGSGLWIAAGDTSSKSLSLIPLNPSWTFDTASSIGFPGAHGDEVVRDVLLDTMNHRVITCGEDGHVRLWATPEDDGPDAGAMDVASPEEESGAHSKKKRRKDKGGDKPRFKPY